MKARDLKRAQTFLFRNEEYEVIACISEHRSSVQNVVCRRANGSTLAIQMHKNYNLVVNGDPKPLEILSMTDAELNTCEPYRYP